MRSNPRAPHLIPVARPARSRIAVAAAAIAALTVGLVTPLTPETPAAASGEVVVGEFLSFNNRDESQQPLRVAELSYTSLPDDVTRFTVRVVAPTGPSINCVTLADEPITQYGGVRSAILRINGAEFVDTGTTATSAHFVDNYSTVDSTTGIPRTDVAYFKGVFPQFQPPQFGAPDEFWVDVRLTTDPLSAILAAGPFDLQVNAQFEPYSTGTVSCTNVRWEYSIVEPLSLTYNPGAEFTAVVVESDPGLVEFELAVAGGERRWEFGDGEVATGEVTSYRYDAPGTYTITHCRTDLDPEVCSTQEVEIAAPELDGNITFIDIDTAGTFDTAQFGIGQELIVRATVEAGDGVGPLDELSFSTPLDEFLTEHPHFDLLSGPTPLEGTAAVTEDDAPVVLEPGERASWEWTVRAARSGQFTLALDAMAMDAIDRPVGPAELRRGAVVGQLQVQFVLPEEPVELLERRPGDLDENGEPLPLNPDGTLVEPGFHPQEVPVTVRVAVPTEGEPISEIELFRTNEADGWIDIDAMRRQSLAGGGFQWVELLQQPVPMPLTVEGDPDPLVVAGPVEPGESVDIDLVLRAEKPGGFQLSALVTGLTGEEGSPQSVVSGASETVLPILGAPLLSVQWAASTTHGTIQPRIEEGNRATFTGVVENLSSTDTIVLDPMNVISLGNGYVLGPVEAGEMMPLPGDIGIFAPELAPGERALFTVQVPVPVFEGIDSSLLSGREAVVLDLGVSGVVIEGDATVRELDAETEVAYAIGNGLHTVEGNDFMRVEVQPQFVAPQQLDFLDFTVSLGVVTMQRTAQNSAETLVALPGMLAALPSAAWNVGTVGVDMVGDELAVYRAGLTYAWAWSHYLLDVHNGMSTEHSAELIEQATDEVWAKFSQHFDNRTQVKALVDNAVTGMFAGVIDYHNRAYDAADAGFTRELVEVSAEGFAAVGTEITIEVATAGLLAWLGKLGRSARAADEVEAAATARAEAAALEVEAATQGVRNSGNDPRVTQAPPSMRTLQAAAPVTAAQAIRGWAIDAVSDQNLRRLTSAPDGLPIIVAIRSRADETLEWMQTALGITVKPVTVKPKSVDWRDVQFLGYRNGVGYGVGDRGAIALAEPLSRQEVIQRLNAANADSFTRSQVLDRHDARWKEWYGVECPAATANCTVPDGPFTSKIQELKDLARVVEVGQDGMTTRRGVIDVPRRGSTPEPGDNFDTSWAAAKYDARQFEMRQIPDPENLGREYFELWLENADGSMRRVAGDIDIVSVTDTTGRTLSGGFAENVGQQLNHLIDAQHPWSSTLANPALRRQFLDAHRWHPDPALRGEPLLLYVGGEARVGWFDPTKSIDPNNPLEAVMWLDGGSGAVDDVVRAQRDLRGQLPDTIDVDAPRGHTSNDQTVRRALAEADQADGGSRLASCSIRTARVGASVYRLSGSQMEARNDDGSWSATTVDEACEGGEIVVLPDTATVSSLAAGTTTVPILDELLGEAWRTWFRIGDCVLFDAGGPKEERACIAGYGSLVLDRPLSFEHGPLTTIVLIEAVNDESPAQPERPRDTAPQPLMPWPDEWHQGVIGAEAGEQSNPGSLSTDVADNTAPDNTTPSTDIATPPAEADAVSGAFAGALLALLIALVLAAVMIAVRRRRTVVG